MYTVLPVSIAHTTHITHIIHYSFFPAPFSDHCSCQQKVQLLPRRIAVSALVFRLIDSTIVPKIHNTTNGADRANGQKISSTSQRLRNASGKWKLLDLICRRSSISSQIRQSIPSTCSHKSNKDKSDSETHYFLVSIYNSISSKWLK